jgi:beta-glucanase (GH16 family)
MTKLDEAMKLLPKTTRAARLALAGAAVAALAACQPVATVPTTGAGSDPTTTVAEPGGNTAVTTTTAAPTTTTTAPPAPATPVAPAGWKYVGGDEFDGTSVDTGRWRPYHNTYGDGNNELACLTPQNVAQGAGTLKITAKKESVTCPGGSTRSYTSGFLGSRETGTYYPKFARFEVRAKVPHAQGLWPAFWLRHRNGAGVAEVDIMEYFHSQVPGRSTQTLHLDGRSNISKKTTTFEAASTTSPAWHTWAVDILPDPNGVRFTFYLDGTQTHTFVDTQAKWATSAPDAGTWDIALNLAVGGKWVGGPDDTLGYLRDLNRCSISGTAPSGCTTTGIRRVDWSKSTYEVDYVRVFTKG